VVHLRIVAPEPLASGVLEVLERSPTVLNIVHLPGAARRPAGDAIICDVPREHASLVLADLRELGIEESGTISLETSESTLGQLARRATEIARGAPADAVVWEEVEERTSESAELSGSFVAFMVIATLIAAVGILTDSLILIIGAMVVGPEFGPVAGVCVAVVQQRLPLARRSLVALGVGFAAAIGATVLGTLILRAVGTAPDELSEELHPATLFISEPSTWSVIVALLAGVAGVLSLTTAKSGALIGVLISVTTIPAAANVGVAAAYADWGEFTGALVQLVINVLSILMAGIATLALQRAAYRRRVAAQGTNR
jgi:uncharacterized hydrophobic protein (TIGR00271 family)